MRARVSDNNDRRYAGGSSQYFLITPKLLTGLKYAPGMKVHCIASGEWLPENATGKEMDFASLAGIRRKVWESRRQGVGTGAGGLQGGSTLVSRVGA